MLQLAEAARRAAQATNEEELAEAVSDMDRLGHESVTMAVAVQLVKIQLERPLVLPLAIAMCGLSLYWAIQSWVSRLG